MRKTSYPYQQSRIAVYKHTSLPRQITTPSRSRYTFPRYLQEAITHILATSHTQHPLVTSPHPSTQPTIMCNYTFTTYQHCSHRAFAASICLRSLSLRYGEPCYARRPTRAQPKDILIDGECEKCCGGICAHGGCAWKLEEAPHASGTTIVVAETKNGAKADVLGDGENVEEDEPPKLRRAVRLGAEEGQAGGMQTEKKHQHWHLPGHRSVERMK